jgi:hypothetical protein
LAVPAIHHLSGIALYGRNRLLRNENSGLKPALGPTKVANTDAAAISAYLNVAGIKLSTDAINRVAGVVGRRFSRDRRRLGFGGFECLA